MSRCPLGKILTKTAKPNIYILPGFSMLWFPLFFSVLWAMEMPNVQRHDLSALLENYEEPLVTEDLTEVFLDVVNEQLEVHNFDELRSCHAELSDLNELSHQMFGNVKNYRMTTVVLGLHSMVLTISENMNLLTSSHYDIDPSLYQMKAEVSLHILMFISSIIYSFTISSEDLREECQNLKEYISEVRSSTISYWISEDQFRESIHYDIISNCCDIANLIRDPVLSVILKGLLKAFVCLYANLTFCLENGECDGSLSMSSVDYFKLIHHYEFSRFLIEQEESLKKRKMNDLIKIIDGGLIDYESALEGKIEFDDANFFFNLMKEHGMKDVLKIYNKTADDMMMAILENILPFEIAVSKPETKQPQQLKKGVKSKRKGRKAAVRNNKAPAPKAVQKPSEIIDFQNDIQHADFKIDQRDAKYGVIVLGNYILKKYLEPTVVALGYEVGDLSWTQLKRILDQRLDSTLNFRRGFILCCIVWVQRRNDMAHPQGIQINASLFTDFQAIRSKLGVHAINVQNILERLVGCTMGQVKKPNALEKGRPFGNNPIPTLCAINLTEAIVNSIFGEAFKSAGHEPSLAALQRLNIDPETIGITVEDLQAIKALWKLRNELAHVNLGLKSVTWYVLNIFRNEPSFDAFLKPLFKSQK